MGFPTTARDAPLLLGLVLLLGGCSPLGVKIPEHRLRETGAYRFVDDVAMPPVRGVAGCGSQALATVLAHERPAVDPVALAESLPWHNEGASTPEILVAARRHGATATLERGTWERLAETVEAGRPALVMLDAGMEVGTLFVRIPTGKLMHWAVVTGMAHDGSRVLLAAPGTRHRVMPKERFMPRWEESAYCLILVDPFFAGPEAITLVDSNTQQAQGK